MRRSLTILTTVLLVVSLFAAAPTAADHNSDESYGEEADHGHEEEHHPACRGANGELQDGSFGLDPLSADEVPPIFVPMNFGFDEDGDGNISDDEQALTICSGEHWDGQDPNTEDSSEDTRADENEGNIYINPLYGGDCSGYDTSSDHNDNAGGSHSDGCEGGEDRPTEGELIHLRVTGDVPTLSNPQPDATIFLREEIWGVGQGAFAVGVTPSNEEAYVSVYLEDHSEQIFHETIGGPGDHQHPLDPINDMPCDDDPCWGGNGNYLTIPFDPVQQGTGDEGDCTSDTYQDPDQGCNRDNSALVTVQIGYTWAPLVGGSNSADTGPQPLP